MPKSSAAAEPPDEAVEAAVGSRLVERRRIESAGYARVNAHSLVRFADLTSAFVKSALTDEADAWLRKERRMYEALRAPFMPRLLGAGEARGRTFLVLEDLSGAEWPPPWTARRIDDVLAALGRVHATAPPAWLSRLDERHDDVVGWPAVAVDPDPLLTTRVCTRGWLEVALPLLLEAVGGDVLAGDALIHFDVRSDNLCFVGDRTVLVDWNIACVGNPVFDVAFWLPSLRLEGGPEPAAALPNAGPVAAAVAGFFAARAGLPPPAGAPTVRDFQRAQLEVALPWAASELGLDPPRLNL